LFAYRRVRSVKKRISAPFAPSAVQHVRFKTMNHRVTIIDVAPRDGLQNEPENLSPTVRAELVERLAGAGLPRVEIGSFVNPKQVPQMEGTAAVAALLRDSRVWTALAPNLKGFELARAAGLRQVRLVLAASEALNEANFKRTVAASLEDFATIARHAHADKMGFGVAIGASFGCPFEGHVAPERVIAIAKQLASLGADEIVLADTTGMAVPTQVEPLCRELLRIFHDGPEIVVHFHNTRNTGYANAYAAWQSGVRHFDAALGGIGGCPFAPRAVGNIATEDLVHMFHGMGVQTGIDLAQLIVASQWLSAQMGKTLPALVGKADPIFDSL
jgi:(R)-citramalyl-CoA lyase